MQLLVKGNRERKNLPDSKARPNQETLSSPRVKSPYSVCLGGFQDGCSQQPLCVSCSHLLQTVVFSVVIFPTIYIRYGRQITHLFNLLSCKQMGAISELDLQTSPHLSDTLGFALDTVMEYLCYLPWRRGEYVLHMGRTEKDVWWLGGQTAERGVLTRYSTYSPFFLLVLLQLHSAIWQILTNKE